MLPWLTTYTRRLSIGFALVVVALVAPAARSQEPDTGSPELASPESVLFDSLPVVEAATLHAQTLQNAPASVTVISSEDIRRYGFRTLGEVLASVRGFYVTYDRSYHYVGLRGFSIPGDYNTRFLVMLNGHYLTENVYSSNGFFGQDFALDMHLIKRIEIVRGPSSALYGSNGIFATINIVTRSPVETKQLRVSTETGSFGEKKVTLSSGMNLGHGANLLVSTSVFHNGGQSLYFPEFDQPENNFGRVRDADAERGYHTFANLIWRKWSFTGLLGSREKQVPTGWYDTIFGDPGNKILDQRGFLEAAYTRDIDANRKFRWRIYYDRYRYRARYDYALENGIEDRRDLTAGDWVGSQLAYDVAIPHVGILTVGGEVNADLRSLQRHYAVSPEPVEYLHVDSPDVGYGIFAQQQWQLAPAWTAYFGVRFDDSKEHAHFVSPRLALVYRASERSSYKFMYGRAFRHPNAYEAFYDDDLTQRANPGLGPERAQTLEVAAERKLAKNLDAIFTTYHYWLDDLIETVTTEGDWLQFRNVAQSHAYGVEAELTGRPVAWIETTASLAVQRATNAGHSMALTNSPSRIGKLRASVPLLKNRVMPAVAVQYLSSRTTMLGDTVPGVWLADLTFTTNALHPNFDLQFGARNLLDRKYYDPVGFGLVQDRLLQDGRALFLRLIWRTRE